MLKNYFKYLNFSATEERWGTYVTTVGYSKTEPNDDYPNQVHPESHQLTWNRGRILNDYYIVFISKGKGLFSSGLTPPTEISEGTCFFLFPGVWHRYKPDPRSGWEEFWIGFNGFYIEKLMDNGFFDSRLPLVPSSLNRDVLVLFQNIIESVQHSLPGYRQQIAGMTIQLLGIINTILQHHEYSHDPVEKMITKAKFVIQQSFEDHLDMEALAKSLPMGYSSFRKAFKRITGESPNQYHLNLRLKRAKNLLVTTVLNISEIAYQTGFESVFYFSRLFKKKNGISPSDFRKNGDHFEL